MAPTYKLTYFNLTGLGEPIRYLLHYGGLAFDDKRIEMADWPAHKASTPFGQVPILEVDGKAATQSSAICRYLAKELGLAGKTNWDAMQADSVVDSITDLRLNYTKWFREQDADAKAKILDDIKNTHNPYYLERLEAKVKENGGYFVSGELTWADIYFAALTDLMTNVLGGDSIVASYPGLKALKEKVEAIPKIKAYRDQRPKTL